MSYYEESTVGNRASVRLVGTAVMLLSAAACVLPAPQPEAGLLAYPEHVVEAVEHSVFEVVSPRADDSNIRYRSPIKESMVPYPLRDSPYNAFGTAFYVGEGLFVSAAHVFQLHHPRIETELYLRNSAGEIREVDNVTAYSTHKDFVVFTIRRPFSDQQALEVGDGQVNTRVYSIGGTWEDRLIIREGAIVSLVPDPMTGTPIYFDTTVPTSAGHSGGPLLNALGEVVGINLSANRHDDLFRALPIQEATPFRQRVAMIDHKIVYSWLHPEMYAEYDEPARAELPLDYKQLSGELRRINKRRLREALSLIYPEHEQEMFPFGRESRDTLVDEADEDLFEVAKKHDDGYWFWDSGEYEDDYYLRNGGYAESRNGFFTSVLRVEMPTNADMTDWWHNEERILDYVLNDVRLERPTNTYPVRVDSLGAPIATETIRDRWGRRWHHAVWEIPYDLSYLSTFIAPTPNGVWFLSLKLASNALDEWTNDMEAMLDFVRYPLSGTADQFATYATNVDLPDGAALTIDTVNGESEDSDVMIVDAGWGEIAVPDKLWDSLSSARISSTFDFYPVEDGYTMALDKIKIENPNGSEIEVLREVNPELYPGFGSDRTWNRIVDSAAVGTVSDEGWMAEYVPAHEGGLRSAAHAFRVRFSAPGSDTEETELLQSVVNRSKFHFDWEPGDATVE